MTNFKKKILILGASGFIGKNLIEYLKNKYILYTPSHKELDLLDGRKLNSYFRNNKIDIVVNCVTVGGSRREEYQEHALNDNLRIFFNIVSNNKYYKKLIYLGSGAEYDKSKPIIKIKEEDFEKNIPADDYGLFKYICSKYIDKLDNVINLRIFGLFGKYEDYRYRFISNAICRNLFELPIIIKQDVYFDYVYINDFVKIVEFFINKDTKYKFYNIGTGYPINLLTIAQKINKIAGKKSKIIITNKGFSNEYTANNNKILKEIKNLEFTNFDIVLLQLYNWYSKNLDRIDKSNL
jgi:GDP-L-fucose synthase